MSVTFSRVVPILLIFDIDKVREFYVNYLGFAIDWEHRFSAPRTVATTTWPERVWAALIT